MIVLSWRVSVWFSLLVGLVELPLCGFYFVFFWFILCRVCLVGLLGGDLCVFDCLIALLAVFKFVVGFI